MLVQFSWFNFKLNYLHVDNVYDEKNTNVCNTTTVFPRITEAASLLMCLLPSFLNFENAGNGYDLRKKI